MTDPDAEPHTFISLRPTVQAARKIVPEHDDHAKMANSRTALTRRGLGDSSEQTHNKTGEVVSGRIPSRTAIRSMHHGSWV